MEKIQSRVKDIKKMEVPQVVAKSKKKKSVEENDLSRQFNAYPKGRTKRTLITPWTLREVAAANPIVQICINKIKQKVAKSPWVVRAKDHTRGQELEAYIDYVKNLLRHPNNNDDTFRTITSKVLEDVLVLDNGVIEKVRNPRGEIVELYHVDGATIVPNLDKYGLYKDPAYYQYVNRGRKEPDAEFDKEDLLVFMADPRGDVGFVGFGRSPVEKIIGTIITSVQAILYNSTYFDETKLPPAVFNLKGVEAEQLKAFKAAWESSMDKGMHQSAFTNAEELTIQLLRGTNRDMQFYELNLWLARVIFGIFEISPQEAGFTMDVNRATAEVQQDITETGGYATYSDVIAEEINEDIITDLARIHPKFAEIEFAWDVADVLDPEKQARIDQIYVGIGVDTPDEIRQRDGKEPLQPEIRQAMQGSNPTQIFEQLFNSVQKSERATTQLTKFFSGPKDWTKGY